MPNLAWGGFANGQIPRVNLVDIGAGKLLQANAAESWKRFAAAFRSRWGDALYLADYQDAYRDIALQQYMWDHRNSGPPHPSKVAAPGNSIHGWARSVDCSGYGQKGSARHNWMVANCANYGWSWAYGRSLNEPWHWDYVEPITTTAGDGGITPSPPEPEEEDMPFYELINGPDGTVWWVVDRSIRYAIPNPSNLATYQAFLRDLGKSDVIVNKGDLGAYGSPVYADPQLFTKPILNTAKEALKVSQDTLAAVNALPDRGVGGSGSAPYAIDLDLDLNGQKATGSATPQN